MTPASETPSTTASNLSPRPRKWRQIVVQKLAQAPLAALAEALEKDESGVCRIRSEEARITFSEELSLLEALGFKAVNQDAVCVSRERYAAIAEIARAALADEVSSRRLIWEDEQ